MYKCSDAFHEAVKAGKEQKALLIFGDCVFTDEDINVTNGIEFHDYFNTEDDLSIGQAVSNEISFSLFNDDRLLNDYEFGDFLATLGVLVQTKTYQQYGAVTVATSKAKYIGNLTSPYITRNGTALASPGFPVKSIMCYDNKVYAFDAAGRYRVYNDSTGADITNQNKLNAFMQNKSKNWKGKGIFYNKDSRYLFIYESGDEKIYEFCPLGVFTAERPNAPDVIQIDMTCYDFMQKFDEDMPSASKLKLSYPATIGALFKAMCDYLKVKFDQTEFINARATISAEPDDFSSATMRDVLKWIAEAAGSNARFNRDGVLQLVWLNETDQSYEANNYSEFDPYWYKTKKVTKLYNRDTQDVTDKTYGTGDECYVIQDNPLLKGVS